jgi:hypothetical protein
MKLVFVDEVEQPHKNADFFGVGALIIDSNFYRGLRAGVEKALKDAGWNLQMEFKGRYLFSSSQGDTAKS